MPTCTICGEALLEGARLCTVCGTSVPEAVPTATSVQPPLPGARRNSFVAPAELSAEGRFCPACGKSYGPEFSDTFCTCGVELLTRAQASDLAPTINLGPPIEPSVSAAAPWAGTRRLVLYGSERQPLTYFPLSKDATLIGRLDAVAGVFPDIDLDEWLEPAQKRKISRQHALILHSRANDGFRLRPLAANTGTQLEGEMVLPMHDYPLSPGQRFILGGAARFKFEAT